MFRDLSMSLLLLQVRHTELISAKMITEYEPNAYCIRHFIITSARVVKT